MFFQWLKRYMPRGLYGRAALILVLPVLTLQLLVSVVFIQRHFEGVTELMTRSALLELHYLYDAVAAADDLAAGQAAAQRIAVPLELTVILPDPASAVTDQRRLIDLSGRVVIATLRKGFPQIGPIDLSDRRYVRLEMDTKFGPMSVSFNRVRVSASNPHQLLVIMSVMGLVMTLIALIFLRNQLRPIKRMADAAAAYGKGRIVPFNPTGAIEVRAAGAAFLDMRNRIERQTQSRTLMLSGVSHDLRTPLTRLRLGLSMLDDAEAAPLIRDVDDMQRLMDEFLEFSRDTAADAVEPTEPVALIGQIVADAHRAGLNVQLGPCEGLTTLDGPVPLRPMAIRRALENLIGNAVRHGTTAEVGLTVTDRTLVFWVEDDGPGIAAHYRDEAMRPFTRLDPARNQNRGGGVGLGLAIVADIARVHGGVLRLGEGARLGGLRADLVVAR
jgi:two-component system osmolarity sensor histidine kinase EnvZ